MNYPPRRDQYGQPNHQRPEPGVFAGASPTRLRGFAFFANLGVVALGVVSFFLGFAPYAKTSGSGNTSFADSENFFSNGSGGVGATCLALLLAAAAIAAFGTLPCQLDHGPVVAGLSLAGSATLLFLLIGLDQGLEAGVGLILVLVAAFLQTALAVAAVLVSAGVIGDRSPRSYGYPPSVGAPRLPGPYDRAQATRDYRRGPYGPR